MSKVNKNGVSVMLCCSAAVNCKTATLQHSSTDISVFRE